MHFIIYRDKKDEKMVRSFIKKIFFVFLGAIVSVIYFSRFCERIMIKTQESAKRNKHNFKCACSWLKQSHTNLSISNWLEKRGIKEVAIYGMGDVGSHLLDELDGTCTIVKYVIDRDVQKGTGSYICYSNSEELPEVEAIIVTPVYDFDKIASSLMVKGNVKIISLEEILGTL